MFCDHPKNMFCCNCTYLYWIKRCKLPVPFWLLCLLTGLKYSCSFGCCDSAGSIDSPDAPYQDALRLEDWHLCCQNFLAFPKSSLWSMSTKKSTDFLLSPAPPGVFEWQLRLAGNSTPLCCTSASKSVLSFLQCQPGSESSICLQLCQIWDSSCFRNKLC